MTDPIRDDAMTASASVKTTDYAPGMRAEIRGEEWMIRGVHENSLGKWTLECVGTSPLVRGREAIFIEELENNAGMLAALEAEAAAEKLEKDQRVRFRPRRIRIVDPKNTVLVPDGSSLFRNALLYIESQWRRQIPTDDKLHVGNRAAMDLLDYQLEPAALALRQLRQRILIADAVGLGKTLEAGILLSELIVRGKGKRVLVVTVKSMMEQFQREMWNRFTIPLVRLDSQKIQSVRANLPMNYNPFNYFDKTIVSVDTLKEKEYLTHLEGAHWDVVVIDEAQNVADRGKSKRNKLGELLARQCDSMIMLSATPHDGRAKSFASLMNMLDPTAIADPEKYGPEEIKGLFIRRSKKDVEGDLTQKFPERKVTVEKVAASEAEERVWRTFADLRLESDKRLERRGAELLFRTLLEKSLFSSHKACAKTIETRLRKIDVKLARTGDAAQRAALEKDRAALTALHDELAAITPGGFSRLRRLFELLKSKDYAWDRTNPKDRIVIFTERIETMNFVADELRREFGFSDKQVRRMSGQDGDKALQELVVEFGDPDSEIRILVASDVASEGLNLHFCSHRLIHFDVPWSLMVFQQRNGRVDRYGQKERPDIRYFLVESSVEEIKGDVRILEILTEKEKQAHENIGDATFFGSTQEEEERRVGKAIESETPVGSYEDVVAVSADDDADDESDDDLDEDLSSLLGLDASDDDFAPKKSAECVKSETLMTDKEFLTRTLDAMTRSGEKRPYDVFEDGIAVEVSGDLKSWLAENLPAAVLPDGKRLELIPDKTKALRRAATTLLLSDDGDNVFTMSHYLWQGHPILSWAADCASLLFNRGAAPLISSDYLSDGELLFLVAGTISNRRSAPVLDEWFGVHCRGGRVGTIIGIDDAVRRAGLRRPDVVNRWMINESGPTDPNAEACRAAAQALVGPVVEAARALLDERFNEYASRTKIALAEERKRLRTLRENQYGVYQLSFLPEEETAQDKKLSHAEILARGRKEKRRLEINCIFDAYDKWAENTMTIENRPYLRIIAAIAGTGAQR